MMASLSERLINSCQDIVDQILTSDVVQKVLMTGDLSGNNKTVFQRTLRVVIEMKDMMERVLPKFAGLPALKPEEKGFVDKMVSDMPPLFGKYLDEFNAAVGPVPDSVKSVPLNKHVLAYLNVFDELLPKNSVIHVWTACLAAYAVPVALQNYTSGNPSYKDNTYSNLAMMKPLGFDQAIVAMKSFVDNRANEVTPAIEAELMALFRQHTDNQAQAMMAIYSGN